jgi:hypothetical protein
MFCIRDFQDNTAQGVAGFDPLRKAIAVNVPAERFPF